MTTAEQIADLLNHYPAKAHVHAVEEPKKSGGMRPIAKPNRELKLWLRHMNRLLNKQFPTWPEFMHGGIRKRSYVTYARPHVGKQCVITVDVKACFDTITQKEVLAAVQKHLHLADGVARQLTAKLCFRGKVPQGFPTSNFMCNLYLLGTLAELNASLTERRMPFGNYVDDIVVSGTIADPAAIVNEIATALSRAKLKTNKAKIKIMPRTGQQVICGLLVNKRLSLTRQLKARLLGEVSKHEMGEASLAGWLLNLGNVDPRFKRKLRLLAVRRGY